MNKELLDKYWKNNLTVDDLNELRKELNASNDDDIATFLHGKWEEVANDENNDKKATIERMRENVYSRIISDTNNNHKLRYFKAFSTAAAVLVIALISVIVALMINSNSQSQTESLAKPFLVTTLNGEKATTILPDGTIVKLSHNSSIEYSLNNNIRHTNFDGEAYFEVAKDSEHPFVINNSKIQITVLGTRFVMSSRDHQDKAEVILYSGSINLKSAITGETAKLKPNDIAVIDCKSGKLDISRLVSSENPDAWLSRPLVFEKSHLPDVLKNIEETYGYTITLSNDVKTSSTFTGTLPVNNINEAIKIIELTFGINADIYNTSVNFHK